MALAENLCVCDGMCEVWSEDGALSKEKAMAIRILEEDGASIIQADGLRQVEGVSP